VGLRGQPSTCTGPERSRLWGRPLHCPLEREGLGSAGGWHG